MNRLLLTLLVALICTGCAHRTHIIAAEIVETKSDSLIVSLITRDDVFTYDDSFWAFEVYLTYSVNDNPFYNEIGTDSEIVKAPFFADRVSETSKIIKNGWFESLWSIPKKYDVGISGRRYFYNLDQNIENLIGVEVAGGTMHFTRIRSNKYVIPHPKPQ